MRSALPASLRSMLRPASAFARRIPRLRDRWRTVRARRAFERATAGPAWLDVPDLERLQASYPFRPEYDYGPEATRARGCERRAALLSRWPRGAEPARRVLEVGCGEGMTAVAFREAGAQVFASDVEISRFDIRARESGVRLAAMDASRLGVRGGWADLVVSFEALEHVPDPGRALSECARAVRTGGLIFLSFGPLYLSPWGLHARRSIAFPYGQALFPIEVLETFARRCGREFIPPGFVNGWKPGRFRALWEGAPRSLEVISLEVSRDESHVDLIERYPSCFRDKTDRFEDLIETSIHVLLRRIV
ncbi:MAG: methyltransferase domain-containing protein [Planctomycetes bacterium]|nr:methyltransferase domain-containing protein [Planctomycetota bacterium]